MRKAARRLRVLVSDDRGRPVGIGGLGVWLPRAAPARARGIVNVALVSDARMRTLNGTYRGKDDPTDVLSFPAVDVPGRRSAAVKRPPYSRLRTAAPLGSPPATPGPFLGDIVIARGMAQRQAREAGHAFTAEVRVLALHGLLHLLGYDHEHDRGQMRMAERRLLRKVGMRDGLIGRARR